MAKEKPKSPANEKPADSDAPEQAAAKPKSGKRRKVIMLLAALVAPRIASTACELVLSQVSCSMLAAAKNYASLSFFWRTF